MRRPCTLQSVSPSITSGEQQRLGQQRSVITACSAAVGELCSAPNMWAFVVSGYACCGHLPCLLQEAELTDGLQLHCSVSEDCAGCMVPC